MEHKNRMPEITQNMQQPITKIKKNIEDIQEQASQMFGLDKNMIVIFLIIAVLIVSSYYLFNGFKKIRDEVKLMKSREIDTEDIMEKVDYNNDSVKAIEIKLDQLIGELSKRDQNAACSVKPGPQHQAQVHAQVQAHVHAQEQVQQSLIKQVVSPLKSKKPIETNKPTENIQFRSDDIISSDDDYDDDDTTDDGIIRHGNDLTI
jgi:hypothetical protein